MRPKFGKSSISMRGAVITSVLYGFRQKKQILRGMLLVQVQ